MRLLTSTIVALACVTGAACGGREGAAPGDSGGSLISVDGSSTVFPITEAVAEEFQKQEAGAKITVGISGTGGGFQKFCRGEIDISDASRPISAKEIEACGTGGISYVELPVAYDGLSVVVNPKNNWVDYLTVAELRRLWEPAAEGKIVRWSQVRPGWPDQEVHLFGAGTDSGTFDYFTEAIAGKSGASRGDYTSSEDDNVLVQGVAGDELALGYFGYAYYEENRDRLKLVPIDDGDDSNGKGPIEPSPETVRTGTYRPLSRPIFIYVNQAAISRLEVKNFVQYYLTEGPDLAREVGYVSLSDREYELVRARFAGGTTGTMYGPDGARGQTLESLLGRSPTSP